jgi:hypothetical protein
MSSTDRDWTEALDAFLADTQTGLTVFTGLLPQKGQQPFDDMRRQVAEKIVHNMFQFVERHGAQGGKHAESEPRPGAESSSDEPGGAPAGA